MPKKGDPWHNSNGRHNGRQTGREGAVEQRVAGSSSSHAVEQGASPGGGGSQVVVAREGGGALQPEDSFDCESLVVSIQAELDKISSTLSQMSQRRCCIYRVPKLLRTLKEEAYTPVLVSIGPFHHNDKRLLPMDTHKLMYLRSFIDNSKTKADLKTYLEIIKDKEREIRGCYAEPIDMPRKEFIQMILIDSTFVIELLRSRDVVMPFTKGEISHDLRLAENQLPFFILKDLYRAAFIPDDMSGTTTMSFTHLACDFLGVDKSRVEVDRSTNEAASSCSHLLDLLRSHYLLPQQTNTNTHEEVHRHIDVDDSSSGKYGENDLGGSPPSRASAVPGLDIEEEPGERSEDSSILCPTATRLYEARVKFRVRVTPCSLLDIHFDREKGILAIPKLLVEGSTECFLINLVAFEQCHYYPAHTYITNYHYFMDCLINTKEDVQLLANARIIENWLGTDDQVADLFNTLLSHAFISPPHYYYASIAEQLSKHCNKRWNRYRATLKHTYFKHPWAVLSVC